MRDAVGFGFHSETSDGTPSVLQYFSSTESLSLRMINLVAEALTLTALIPVIRSQICFDGYALQLEFSFGPVDDRASSL